MALVLKDRVKQQTTTTGQGTITLSGSYTGFQGFDEIGNGNVTYYTIYDQTTGDWEVGYGTYTASGTTLSRDFVYDSSNAGAKIDLQAGTKVVFCTYPAEQAIYQETNGDLKLVGGVIGMTIDGTEGTTLPHTSFQAFTTGNYYMQANQQNLSSGAEASSDWVATADNGTDTTNYMDVGMASSGYNYPDFSAQKPNSGYVMSTGSDLRLIAGKYGASVPGGQDIVLIAGSTKDTEERARVYGDTGNVNIGGGVNATDTGERLQVLGSAKVTGATTFGDSVTLNQNPSAALEAATKQYVDQQSSTGIHIHEPCDAETSSALSAVYTQGGTTFDITDITGTNTVVTSATHGLSVDDQIWLYSTAGNGLATNTPYFVYDTPTTTSLQLSASFGGPLLTGLTNATGLTYATRANSGVGAYLEASANEVLPIAGVSVSDRVLVYQQATGYWDGVYTVTSLGSVSSKWKLTRATDANKYEPSNTLGMGAGDYFLILSNSESYVLTDPTGPIIIGYDAITYTLFSAVPIYTGTSPIVVTGSVISLDTVPVAKGGTNLTSYTSGDLLYAAGSTTLNKLAVGSSGQTIVSAGGLPTWGTLDMAGAGVSGVLPESHGGTNQSSYVIGDLLYSSATNTLAKLAGNTTTTKKYLVQTGTGSASAAPSWDTVAASDITSGTLAVARGGTGLGSYTTGDIVYASGTGALAGLADTATGNVLLSGGINTAPAYGKVGLTTHVSGTLPITSGGTGATSAGDALTALGAQAAATAITTSNIGSQSVNYATTAGSANNIDGVAFTNAYSGSAFVADTTATNGIGYSTGYTLFGQNDGGIYCSTYSADWQHQINGDFRTGQIAIRGKNSGSWQAWRVVLDSSNYTSYAPSLTGSGASGSWGISITGSATSLNGSNYITSTGSSGNANTDFQNTPAYTVRYNGDAAAVTNNPGGTWWFIENMRHSNAGNYWGTQIAWGWEDNANRLATRNVQAGTFGAWVYYINSANVGSYALPIGGGALTGGFKEAKSTMGANNIDITLGNYFSKTISGATTLTVSNVPATGTAASFILDLTNGGSATITWWSGMKWAGGTAPTLTASGRDILGFFTYDGGTTWNGLVLAKDVK